MGRNGVCPGIRAYLIDNRNNFQKELGRLARGEASQLIGVLGEKRTSGFVHRIEKPEEAQVSLLFRCLCLYLSACGYVCDFAYMPIHKC